MHIHRTRRNSYRGKTLILETEFVTDEEVSAWIAIDPWVRAIPAASGGQGLVLKGAGRDGG